MFDSKFYQYLRLCETKLFCDDFTRKKYAEFQHDTIAKLLNVNFYNRRREFFL